MTSDRFDEMLHDEYVPLVEKERLSLEYLSLKQKTETVTMITRMFHERALFCPEYASSELAEQPSI